MGAEAVLVLVVVGVAAVVDAAAGGGEGALTFALIMCTSVFG